MSTTEIRALITAEIATLTRVVSDPAPPFGYGKDVAGWTDMDPGDASTDNEDLALAQELVRRLITPRGTLPGDSVEERDYGTDLRMALNTAMTPGSSLKYSQEATGELRKDDRVLDAQVVVSSNGRNSLDMWVRVTRADNRRSFTFTGTVTTLGVEALAIAA